ncbi:hypothetical protein OG21DRAFT_1491776, partial [Imleria badia]
MVKLSEILSGPTFYGTGEYHCYDNQYRPTYHGTEQRYFSPTTGRCSSLKIQAVHPRSRDDGITEIAVGENTPKARKLALWLVLNRPRKVNEISLWLMRWIWFTLALVWPFNVPKHTGLYPAYLSRYYGQLWAARSPREYSLRKAKLGVEPVDEITHSTHPPRLVIRDPASKSWKVCSDSNIIKQQKYVTISYTYSHILPQDTAKKDHPALKAKFITQVEAIMASLGQSAYWIDLTLVDEMEDPAAEEVDKKEDQPAEEADEKEKEDKPPKEVDKDLYHMADVYRGAEFTLIMLCPPAGVTEESAWLTYGQRLWTFPEALLSRELRFKFRDDEVTPITLHQLGNRAYPGFAEESAIINAYGLRDPLERLARLSLLKSALWRRTSSTLEELEKQ